MPKRTSAPDEGGAGPDQGTGEDRPDAGAGAVRQGHDADRLHARIEQLRASILECDSELIRVLRQRRDLVREIGEAKRRLGLPVTDPRREAAVVRRAARLAREAGLDEEMIRRLIWQIMSAARSQQQGDPQGPD